MDGQTGNKLPIETGVPQGSPVSPILFAIYLSGVFSIVDNLVPGIEAKSFVDDCGFTVEARSILEVTAKLQDSGTAAVVWSERNFLTFDLGKDEAILFDKTLKRRHKSR